jgi:hypothetical protein
MENLKNEVANIAEVDSKLIEQLVLNNDLAGLTPAQRVSFYMNVCKSLGLNYLTQPFGLISFEGKTMMYAKRDCTDQLRKIHRVNIEDMQTKSENGLLIVTVKGMDQTGRRDVSTGVIPLRVKARKWSNDAKGPGKGGYIELDNYIDLEGKDLANAIMKAETKAKRRLTLSLVGLGIPDESELETMQGVKIGTFEQPPVNDPVIDETIDAEILDYWNQALQECKNVDEVDLLAVNNKEVVEPSATLRKLFMSRKKNLTPAATSQKEKAKAATDFVNEQLKK